MTVSTTTERIALRASELLLGIVFIAGAVLKAKDINLFAVQIGYYGVLAEATHISIAAVASLAIETGIGVALAAGLRLRGLTHVAVLALLAVFTGLIAYAWAFHGLKDCGCFGPIEISPGVSILKNVAMGAIAVLALCLTGRQQAAPVRWKPVTGKLVLVVLLMAGAAAYAAAHLQDVAPKERPFAQFVFDVDGQAFDLGSGEYLVAMLSMTCEDCMASVPALNDLFYMPGLPPLVALCYEAHQGAMEAFRNSTNPEFPMHSLGDQVRLFFSLVNQEPPRLNYVRDGERLAFWDETIPSVDQIQAALAQYRNAPAP